MTLKVLLLCTLFFISLSTTFLEIDSKNKLKRLFDLYPQKPALVIYQSTTDTIRDYQNMYQKLHLNSKDYCLVIIVNCQQNVEQQKKQIYEGCPGIIKYPRQLVVLEGYIPADSMLSIRGKMFRMVPNYVQNQVERSFQSLSNIVQSLIPNYIEKLYNEEDIQQFLTKRSYLLPRVLIYGMSQEDTLMKKLSVYFNDRAKFGQVLKSQNPQNKLEIYQYDFNRESWIQHVFPSKINIKLYGKIKTFIEQYASKRIMREQYDYMRIEYSKIHYSDQSNYTKTVYQNTQKHTIVFKGNNMTLAEEVINKYKQKYGQFINYIIYNSTQQNILYPANSNTTQLPLDIPQLSPFTKYRFDDIQTNAQGLIDHGYVILLAEPQLDYICSIQNLKVLSDFFSCFPIIQKDVNMVKRKFEIPDEDKMAILFTSDKNNNFAGKNINNLTFTSVVSITYNVVRSRIKALAKKFSNNPIFPIEQDVEYSKVCTNCFVYLHSKQPNFVTIQNYKNQALQFNNVMPFYFGYFECHSQLFKHLNKQSQNILLFISSGKLFYAKQYTEGVAGKIIRRWKQKNLKMSDIPDNLKTDKICVHYEQFKTEKQDSNENQEL